MAHFKFESSVDFTEHCNKLVNQSNKKIKLNALMNSYSRLANYPTLKLYKQSLDKAKSPFEVKSENCNNLMLIELINTLCDAQLFSLCISIGYIPRYESLTQDQAVTALSLSDKDEVIMILYKDKGMEDLQPFLVQIVDGQYVISCDERSSEYVEGYIVKTSSSALSKIQSMRRKIESIRA